MAKKFVRNGASKIHLVDLNAAAKSDPATNAIVLEELLEKIAPSVDLQCAGGIRSLSVAKSLVARGAKSIVIGSLAYSDPTGAKEILTSLGSKTVVLALDYDGSGIVRTTGWRKAENEMVEFALRRFSEVGFRQFLLTSINRDGLMKGPDLAALTKLRKFASRDSKICASGGVSTVDDLVNLEKIGMDEAIVGKAIYEGTIPLSVLKKEV